MLLLRKMNSVQIQLEVISYMAFNNMDDVLGKYKVKLTENSSRKTKRIMKGGFRSYTIQTDESFPLLAWHPSGKIIAVIRERKGKIWLGFYTLDTKKYEESQLFNVEKILDFSYSDDGQLLVMSAVQKGQSDIFVFNVRSRTYEQITNDLYDDLNPRFFRNATMIAFSSNRDNDSLNAKVVPVSAEGSYDIFIYDYQKKSSMLKRVTATKDINEMNPVQYDSLTIAYLTDKNGISNRSLARLDSVISYIDTVEHYRYIIQTKQHTDYYRSVLWQDVNYSMNKLSEIVFENGRYRMYANDIKPWDEVSLTNPPANTAFREGVFKTDTVAKKGEPVVPVEKKSEEVKNETHETAPADSGKINFPFSYFKPSNKSLLMSSGPSRSSQSANEPS